MKILDLHYEDQVRIILHRQQYYQGISSALLAVVAANRTRRGAFGPSAGDKNPYLNDHAISCQSHRDCWASSLTGFDGANSRPVNVFAKEDIWMQMMISEMAVKGK